MKHYLWPFLFLILCCSVQEIWATNYDAYGGPYSNWPVNWTAIPALNDPDDGVADDRFEIVGDNDNPAAYWSSDTNYFYFRMRIDAGTPGPDRWGGSFFVLIDQTNRGVAGSLEYAFAWDNKEADHGLEMLITNVTGSTWGSTKMNDIDGAVGSKIVPPDIGTDNGDGYLRTVEEQPTTNFGTTTFIDFAVSWSYLAYTNQTTLRPGQIWKLQVGTIEGANDHGFISRDVGAAKSPSDTGLPFASDPITTTIPMLSDLALLVLGGAIGYAFYRRQSRIAAGGAG